jgi:exodeoxyribonuclease VII small subunit
MSSSKPKTKSEHTPVEDLTYEQALAELESTIATLESNQLTLDETMALFERGQQLTRHCIELLDMAELRVMKLSGDTLQDMPIED